MPRQTVFALVGVLVLLVSATSVAAAQPGEGPPSDMPDVVPSFVSDILGAISDFIAGVLGFADGRTSEHPKTDNLLLG